ISSVKRYCGKAKLIFDTVDLQFLREQRRAEVENDEMVLRQANRMKRTEFQLARGTNITFVVTPVDKEIMLKEDPSLNVEILSNIDEVRPPERTFSERSDMMFLGGFSHLPNVDAVKWFVEEIFPVIKREIPDAKFYVVGVDPPPEIQSLGSDDVIVTGYVKDLVPYFEKCRVFVSPLRYGAGVKGKINRSMSHGVPVVTTSIGAEGMELVDGEDTLIADEPAEFAEKVVTIYKNEELWGKLSRNSLKNVQEYYSYETAREQLKEIIGRL
ncbi:MAG: glycosyltransferase family 4 protein, partial [Candidatus Hydrothermarchaeaceae archaeon]